MAYWYIKSSDTENWKAVSLAFRNWLVGRQVVGSFGYSEGESIVIDGVQYQCFCVPDRHGDNVWLFREWAEATGRICRTVDVGRIVS